MLIIQEKPSVEPVRRSRRWMGALRWVLALALLVVAVGVLVLWWLSRPPAPVSVNDVIHKFRNTSPSSAPRAIGGPRIGVYLYATHGSERISAGHITHHYPQVTTLTVTSDPCGLSFQWDALAGRFAKWQVCRAAAAWSLIHYVDAHSFLYMKDVLDYSCSGFPTVVCRTDTGMLTSTVTSMGRERVTVGGAAHVTTHLRIAQVATGKSVSEGTIDVWVLASGLPARVYVVNHGAQTVLGSRVTYQEDATFALTSMTPRR